MGMCECKNQSPFLLQAECYVEEDNHSSISKQSQRNKNISHHKTNNFSPKTKNSIIPNSTCVNSQNTNKIKKPNSKNSFSQSTEKHTTNSIHLNNNNYNGSLCFSSVEEENSKISSRQTSIIEKDKIIKYISELFLFKIEDNDLNIKNIEKIIHEFKYKTYEAKQIIFNEGDESKLFYIIIKGQCELYSKDYNRVIQLKPFSCFGELALIKEDSVRTYSVKALLTCTCLVLSQKEYKMIKEKYLSPNKPSASNINEIKKIINNIDIFNYLDEEDKENIYDFCSLKTFQKGEMNIQVNDNIIILNKGHLIGMNNEIELHENSINVMINHLLFQLKQPLLLKCNENSSVIYIDKSVLRECFGLNFQMKMLFPYFKHYIYQSDYFSKTFNQNELIEIFKLLKISNYPSNTEVFSTDYKRKFFIIIDGVIEIPEGCPKNKLCEQIITYSIKIEQPIQTLMNSTLLECDWDDITNNMNLFNSSLIQRMKLLQICDEMSNISNSLLIDITSNIQKNKYKQGDVIIPPNTNEYKFCFIIKGEVQLMNNNKIIKTYSSKNVFGEHLFCTKHDNGDYFVVSSEKATLFIMSHFYFQYLLLQDKTFNYNITMKINREDRNIHLKDLYLLYELNQDVSIVHNTRESYIVEKIVKIKNNLQKVINEVKYNQLMSHSLVANFNKVLESKHYMLYLYQNYNNYLTLEKYIQDNNEMLTKDITIKINVALFYASNLFIIIDYFHSKMLLHRNITTYNILINNDGYIKLKGFSLIKHLENGYTKTICGIPKFTAPEILNGESYSFSADYWSVGICLYYMYYSKYPFDLDDTGNPWSVYSEIVCKKLNFKNCDKAIRPLLERLLCKDKEKRIQSLNQVKEFLCSGNFNIDGVINKSLKLKWFSNQKEIVLNLKDKSNKYETYIESHLTEEAKTGSYGNDWSKNF